jgi:hypothetical protein
MYPLGHKIQSDQFLMNGTVIETCEMVAFILKGHINMLFWVFIYFFIEKLCIVVQFA